jgi:hypothetical protein
MTYHRSFAEEYDARDDMTKVWKDLKEKDPATSDAYCDELVRIAVAGFLREYVVYFFHAPEWTDAPHDLHMAEFKDWLQKNIPAHRPRTLATATLEKKY